MEIHDFEQEHLESILTEDEPAAREAEPTCSSVRQIQASHPRGSTGKESNTSKERYDLLPDYAQASFVEQNDDNNPSPKKEHASLLTIQDSRKDVEVDLPKEIKTPVTKRARDMVRMTAIKCVSAPQLEVLLKVKQAGNPEFSFLLPHNECHAYYEWLKERQQKQQESLSRDKEEEVDQKKGGLSLLDMYSSSSDEGSTSPDNLDKEQAKDQPQVPSAFDASEIPEGSSASAPVNDDDGDDNKRPTNDADQDAAAAKRARRLKRAKLMRGHYRLQLMESNTKNP